jgi:NitT/TauT family transport system permease protein
MEGAVIRRVMNIVPKQQSGLILAVLPFILIAAIYLVASAERRAVNPDDRLLPPIAEMAQAVHHLAIEPDRRTGEIRLWTDTAASLQRLAVGLGFSAFIGLSVGLAIGIVPTINTTLGSLIAVMSMVPPMAVLPILFIVFGLGEVSKVALIVFGVAPYLIRDMALAVAGIPREQLIKAQSLGASTWQVALRVVLPQIMPRLIEALRLSLCSAFLFLISAEAIAADAGLGYRIFLVRRYLAMDVILPYVAWITLLSYAIDFALAQVARRGFAWAYADRR